jgi:hypothetical protein
LPDLTGFALDFPVKWLAWKSVKEIIVAESLDSTVVLLYLAAQWSKIEGRNVVKLRKTVQRRST